MDTTILQVPITKKLREEAAVAAVAQGFSSVQEAVRVFLKQLAAKSLNITFEPKSIKLSAKNDRRYTKMTDDFESGRVKTKSFTDVNELMKYLNA